MRTELKNFEEYYWGLTKGDFNATSDLVKSFMKAYWKGLELPKGNKIKASELDLYIAQHYRETQLLIQFGIWRLQSIFESLLKTNFDVEKSNGIRDIINAVKRKGYTVKKESELFQWTNLRNKLSHNAPERCNPFPTHLIEKDMEEFSNLLLEIYEHLEIQKCQIEKR